MFGFDRTSNLDEQLLDNQRVSGAIGKETGRKAKLLSDLRQGYSQQMNPYVDVSSRSSGKSKPLTR